MRVMPTTDPATLRLAHSPDSDDLVMWWPLTGMRGPGGLPVDGELGTPRVDLEGLRFELVGEDVEALNAAVRAGDDSAGLDVTAISAATYPAIADRWAITRCGGSFGEGYGPRVVVRTDSAIEEASDLVGKSVAVPGLGTSAFMTLSMLLGGRDRFEAHPMLFSDVPGAVVEGRCDAGLLIHEAQLTFEQLGLRKVVDLGAWWGGRTGLPLPLGLNVVRRDLDDRFGPGTVGRVGRVLMRSVVYAVEHAAESREYLLLHSEGRPEWRDPALVERYLSMYVSRMSLDMGERGVGALTRFLGEGARAGLVPACGAIEVV